MSEPEIRKEGEYSGKPPGWEMWLRYAFYLLWTFPAVYITLRFPVLGLLSVGVAVFIYTWGLLGFEILRLEIRKDSQKVYLYFAMALSFLIVFPLIVGGNLYWGYGFGFWDAVILIFWAVFDYYLWKFFWAELKKELARGAGEVERPFRG